MKVAIIEKYGVYDSKKLYTHSGFSAARRTTCFEIDYILSCDKDAVSFIDDLRYNLSPNLLIVRKPNQISYSKLHFKCYCLHLKIDENSSIYDDLVNVQTYFPLINENEYKNLFEILFKHIVKDEKNKKSYFTNAKLLELFHYLIKDSKINRYAELQPRKKENLSVQKAILYIKNNFDSKITLTELGNLTGYTPNHFQRIFTSITGTSPQKYLEEIRIKNAKFLLSQNELSIADVAYACGFSSQSYFCKTFKKTTLISPIEFRNSTLYVFSNK